MAQVTLGDIKLYLKKMYDWIGGSSDAPNIKNVNGDGDEIFTDANPGAIKLTGSNLEYYGATEGDRPAANSVPVGAMYMAVQPQKIWQSDGSDWVEVL